MEVAQYEIRRQHMVLMSIIHPRKYQLKVQLKNKFSELKTVLQF